MEQRLVGIQKDAPRGGRSPDVRAKFEAEIIRRTTQETPSNRTHWSTRSMAKAVGCKQSMVSRVWRDNGLKPHLTKTFKVSNDPEFAEKLVDVVGLYLNPPDRALGSRATKRVRSRLSIERRKTCQCSLAAWAR